MDVRFRVDLTGVILAIGFFGVLWLPKLGFFEVQPFAVPIIVLNFFLGIYLLVELIAQGKQRLWLLAGIIPALYLPVWLVFGLFIACPMGWTSCDF